MIITLTLNPAVDQTVWVPHLEVAAVNRARQAHLDPAGKGVNVSRMAHRLGWPTIAFGFLAGEVGEIVRQALAAEGVAQQFIPIAGQTRINVTVVDDSSHAATSIFCPGPAVEPDHLQQLDAVLQFWLQAGRVLVLAGSLPPGIPEDAYARYIRLAHAQGIRTILDASGEHLRLGVEARPYAIKPNVAEAEELLGRRLPDLEAVVAGARELAARGIAVVVISMGAQGAICVEGGRVWRATPPEVERQSTVGSGDSFVAGLAVALARGEGVEAGLRLGTAAGAATAATPGTELGSAEAVQALLPQVRVVRVG
jgi:1-phosphofructokinase family hexose kinase